jgi:hypothetical protein
MVLLFQQEELEKIMIQVQSVAPKLETEQITDYFGHYYSARPVYRFKVIALAH